MMEIKVMLAWSAHWQLVAQNYIFMKTAPSDHEWLIADALTKSSHYLSEAEQLAKEQAPGELE